MSTVNLTETLLARHDFEIEVEIEAEIRMVDNGIGPYEYWGARGCHHQYEPECEEWEWFADVKADVDSQFSNFLRSINKLNLSRKRRRKWKRIIVRRIEEQMQDLVDGFMEDTGITKAQENYDGEPDYDCHEDYDTRYER